MKRPLVSICIPTYNSSDYIQETLQSVFDQTYDNIELLISDDASSDDTLAKVQQMIEKSSIPIILKTTSDNSGIEGNWNQALSMASGTFIKLLPADDTLHPSCIETQVNAFEAHGNDITLVFCARKVVTRSGKALLTARFYPDQKIENHNLLKRCILSGTNVIGEPGAVLFRKSLADKVGSFNGEKPYVIDLNYWIRLLKHGHAIAQYNALSTFRIDNNLSVRLGWSRFSEYSATIDAIRSQWNISVTVASIGKLRALLNEALRRCVHFVYRAVG